ncbi:hypothetical protein EC957_007448 [Mortierella hygrophila]|uniref:Kazal-like domain-containing protein n=1 Tax=Mortierella hygrophila TaxID=979708 RepID=A0A9P6JYJ1_9FUNG|nr:hypothetical protein EC957_007448 [Mortierella hygrophila]
MMYLTTVALLAVILSIQFRVYVQAGPIPLPATGSIPILAAAGGPKAWPVGAMDPVKRDTLQRTEGMTAKYIAKRTTATGNDDFSMHIDDAAIGSASVTDSGNNGENTTSGNHETGVGILPIPRPPPSTKRRCSDICPAIWQPLCAHNKMGDKKTFGNTCQLNFQAVAQERCADKDVDPQAKPDATIEAIEPIRKDIIERAEYATTTFLPKRATEAETIAITTTEKRGLEEGPAAGTPPELCPSSTLTLFILCTPKTGWSVYDLL